MNNLSPNLRMIWVAPRFPLGTPDGARHATRSLIHHLAQENIGIDLVCLLPKGEEGKPETAQKQLNLLSCSIISRSRSLWSRLPSLKTPFTFRTFAKAGVRAALKEKLSLLLKTVSPAQKVFIIFDGLHPFAAMSDHFGNLSKESRGIVYRAHNVETALWEQCEQKARMPWFRWFFRHQAHLVRTFETHVARQVDVVAPVSEEDGSRFREMAPQTSVSVVRIGMDFPEETTLRPIPHSIPFPLLFIGRLDWLPNREGLSWFLENIWPSLIAKRRDMSLKIAGVGDGRWLSQFQHLAGVECLGKVEDTQVLYETCALSIAPLFQGSGTRVKIIEASRYGRPVLTTALGAEGSGLEAGKSYFQAETPKEWLTLLETVSAVDCQKLGVAAFRRLRERFDAKTIAKQFAQLLDRMPAKPSGTSV